MHPRVFEEFERICKRRGAHGAVLEVGATPDGSTLLNMECLKGATLKIGINLDGPHTFRDFSIVKGDANDMAQFKGASFDTVLCNATLEHDKCFWKTIAEIRRVAKSGALIVIGTPGYVGSSLKGQIGGILNRVPLLSQLLGEEMLKGSTATLCVHNYPGDYYRFSEQAVRDVFFEGIGDVEIVSVMTPPRVIGAGIKP